MKNLLYILLFVPLALFGQELYNIPDANFRSYLQEEHPEVIVNDSLDTNAATSIWSIDCHYREITDLDGLQFFTGLTQLNCYNNQLTTLPELPESLAILNCSSNQLTSLPEMPVGLIDLMCQNNELISLPEFHDATDMSYFDCSNNQITELPEFHENMYVEIFDCSNNQITSLPEFHENMSFFIFLCHNNQITSLPEFHENMHFEIFVCSNNQITELPELPENVFGNLFDCSNNQITTLPELPNNLMDIIFDSDEIECITNCPELLIEVLGQYPICSDISYQISQAFNALFVSVSLAQGWNMFGYSCTDSIDVIESLLNYSEYIAIVKDNNGSVYIPEFGFNGIGDFTRGYGYQIKVTEDIEEFSLCDLYIDEIPVDNIVSLQVENASLQAELDSIYGCIDEVACNYDLFSLVNDGSCNYSEHGYDCEGNLTAQLGDEFQGGILIYIDWTGEHGLVAATEDLTEGSTFSNELGYNGYEWGCIGVSVEGADSYYGYQNTMDIVNQGCSTENGGVTAAQAALDYVTEGYSDWFLPSNVQLMDYYMLLEWMENGVDLGNLTMAHYWTSNDFGYFGIDDDFNNAISMTYTDPSVIGSIRSSILPVRPIRSF